MDAIAALAPTIQANRSLAEKVSAAGDFGMVHTLFLSEKEWDPLPRMDGSWYGTPKRSMVIDDLLDDLLAGGVQR